jgi:hypothetical protein
MARKRREPQAEVERLQALLADPDTWPTLDAETLGDLVLLLCIHHGVSPSGKSFGMIGPVYAVLRDRAPPEFRSRLEQRVVEAVLGGVLAEALVPFIAFDTSLTVISSAALDYAVLMLPDEEAGIYTGALQLQVRAKPESGLPELTRTGILMGLVLLGDRRLLPLLEGSWQWLGPEGRTELTRTSSGFVTVALIEYFLSWLEQTEDENDFGGILGTLCRMPSVSRGGMVADIERVFPVTAAGDGDPFRILGSWTFRQVYEWARPRLDRIAEREAEPKYTPEVARYWMAS